MFLRNRERTEQRTILKQHAKSLLQAAQRSPAQPRDIDPQHIDAACRWACQTDHRAQQDGLAGAGSADNTHDLAGPDRQRQVVVDDLRTKRSTQPVDLNHIRNVGCHMPMIAKKTENAASNVMTRKILSTTERVVSAPTDSALPPTRNPSKQPTSAMTNANTGALMRPTQ